MPSFDLEPVDLSDFDPARRDHYAFTVPSTMPARELWNILNSPEPLSWCSGIRRAAWTCGERRGVGATRRVTLSTGVRLAERYFYWSEESGKYDHAFTVDSATAPLFRRFGERCTVLAAGTGSLLTWQFVIEPRVPAPLRPIARWAIRRDIEKVHTDTSAHLRLTAGAHR